MSECDPCPQCGYVRIGADCTNSTFGTTITYTIGNAWYGSGDYFPTAETPEELFRKWWAKREASMKEIIRLAREWKPIPKIIQLAVKRFQRRSDPRWGASVWKAKT